MTVRIQLKPSAGGKSVKKSKVYEWNSAGGTSNGYNGCSVGMLSAIFYKYICTTLFAKLGNSGAYFWPIHMLLQ